LDDIQNRLNWKVFPNPVFGNEMVSIDGYKSAESELFIYNMDGRLMFNTNLTLLKGRNQIDISQGQFMNSGVYNVVLHDKENGQKSSQKLVVFE